LHLLTDLWLADRVLHVMQNTVEVKANNKNSVSILKVYNLTVQVFLPIAMGLIKIILYLMLLWQASVHLSHKYKTNFNTHSFMFHICLHLGDKVNTASIVTRLYVGWLQNLCSIPRRSKIFFSSPNKSRPSLGTLPPIQ